MVYSADWGIIYISYHLIRGTRKQPLRSLEANLRKRFDHGAIRKPWGAECLQSRKSAKPSWVLQLQLLICQERFEARDDDDDVDALMHVILFYYIYVLSVYLLYMFVHHPSQAPNKAFYQVPRVPADEHKNKTWDIPFFPPLSVVDFSDGKFRKMQKTKKKHKEWPKSGIFLGGRLMTVDQ